MDEFIKENVQVISSENDDFSSPTLRDISIIMHKMVGQGVTWQLANEIAKKFDLNPYEVSEFLCEVFEEYSKISDDENWERWNNHPQLYGPMIG